MVNGDACILWLLCTELQLPAIQEGIQCNGMLFPLQRVRNEYTSNREINILRVFIGAILCNFHLKYFPEQQLNLTRMIYKGLDWPFENTNCATDIFNFLLFCPRLTLLLSSTNRSQEEKHRLERSIYPETILRGPLLILSEFQTLFLQNKPSLLVIGQES